MSNPNPAVFAPAARAAIARLVRRVPHLLPFAVLLPALTACGGGGGGDLYSDYCGGSLRSLVYRNGAVGEVRDWPVADIGNVVWFGQDGQNELYMLSAAGTVYRIVRAP
ncbi:MULTISPECIES: hypothetical protein [unclassified Janthinobacterium]|uniref:hypothetical protein n=1 Tax=unclassified Janthinobacterium TaxID=2610881 RepID=UPI00034AF3FA|nr:MULTISPECIES: hypothetical protein [unclassified Janthinobacterium]MEC5159227.1 hypothetical protein [Janthinobacterium sp. CG_S6]